MIICDRLSLGWCGLKMRLKGSHIDPVGKSGIER